MKTKYNFDSSLRRLPWSDNVEQTKTQTLISSTINEWYDAKHRNPSAEEIDFINSILPSKCPYCNSNRYIKYGFRNKIRIYKCKGL